MRVCISCMLSAFREYQCRYPVRRQPYRLVLERVRLNLREKGTLMTYALAGRGRCNVLCGEAVFYIVHDNTSASTSHISSATDDFLREQHGVLCVRIILSLSCATNTR
jgi:hypothetical protein